MEAEERPSKVRKLDLEEQCLRKSDEAIDSMSTSFPSKPMQPTAQGSETSSISGQYTFDGTSALDGVESHLIRHKSGCEHGNDIDLDHDAVLPAPEETAPALVSVIQQENTPPLSKSQQKKLRKRAEWDSKREERKVIRKEKQVAKRERKRAAKQQQAEREPAGTEEKPAPHKAITLPVTIMIDCDFDDLMRDHERVSLSAQITRSYSDNKNSRFKAHLTICSFGGKLMERFNNVLTHYKSWRGVRVLESDFKETADKAREWMTEEKGGELAGAFSRYAELDEAGQIELKNSGEVVYLSSEAEEDLVELKPYSTYIIGGLVDKNREKGVCHKRAVQRGVRTARLPIGEYMDMQSRKVLATNHVNEIMVKWLECGDWGQAFLKAIPKRKGGRLRGPGIDDETPAAGDEQAAEDVEKESNETTPD